MSLITHLIDFCENNMAARTGLKKAGVRVDKRDEQ